jgi:hypothetical protein
MSRPQSAVPTVPPGAMTAWSSLQTAVAAIGTGAPCTGPAWRMWTSDDPAVRAAGARLGSGRPLPEGKETPMTNPRPQQVYEPSSWLRGYLTRDLGTGVACPHVYETPTPPLFVIVSSGDLVCRECVSAVIHRKCDRCGREAAGAVLVPGQAEWHAGPAVKIQATIPLCPGCTARERPRSA